MITAGRIRIIDGSGAPGATRDGDLTTLTTQLHGVNTTLDDAGLGSSLLCT